MGQVAFADGTRSHPSRHFETIVTIGLNLNQVNEHLMIKIPEMQSWAQIFIQAKP